MIPLEALARPLLFVHFATAMLAVGSAVHLAVRMIQRMRRSDAPCGDAPCGRESLHARTLAFSYALCFALGALVYPTYRVRVRQAYFDPQLPWATGLFEAKEHLATLGLAAVVGLAILARIASRGDAEVARRLTPMMAGLLLFVLLVLGWQVGAGWYLVTLRSV